MIREFVIGLLVFTAVALVLLQTVSYETTKNFPEVTINSSYVQDYHYAEADNLVDGVSSKAPGGEHDTAAQTCAPETHPKRGKLA